jgi:N-acyl-phosphatidylethanolamine-hydrolysing phospholipase D
MTASHHGPDGRFRIPWPMEDSGRRTPMDMVRWMGGRLLHRPPPDPGPEAFPRAAPSIVDPPPTEQIRITWVGQSTFLVQAGGLNLLTDPHWSDRASPSRWIGPRRLTPPGISWESLPAIDAVLLSHDHYDHLDDPTVRRLHERFGASLVWITPLGYRTWLAERGVHSVTELDWWQETTLTGGVRVTCAPAQHWTRRGLREYNDRLWCSFSVSLPGGGGVYFAGDSGYFPAYAEIGARLGPWDALLMPIGAYDPRWFMKPAHMNPEEAVQAYLDLGGSGAFLAMHWGTFRLTDEDALEPPLRARAAWSAAGLPAAELHVPRHGETVVLTRTQTEGIAPGGRPADIARPPLI